MQEKTSERKNRQANKRNASTFNTKLAVGVVVGVIVLYVGAILMVSTGGAPVYLSVDEPEALKEAFSGGSQGATDRGFRGLTRTPWASS